MAPSLRASAYAYLNRVVESGDFHDFQDFTRRAARPVTILNNVRPPESGIMNNVHSGAGGAEESGITPIQDIQDPGALS